MPGFFFISSQTLLERTSIVNSLDLERTLCMYREVDPTLTLTVTGVELLQNCCAVNMFGHAVYIMNRHCGKVTSEVQFVIKRL